MSIDTTSIFGSVEQDWRSGICDALLIRRAGSGGTRIVYDIFGLDHVLKVEQSAHVQNNVLEFSIWEQWSETKEGERWLVPCQRISNNGRALVQDRVQIITDPKDPRLPKKIPRLFTDTKVTNWGIHNGEVKCCDYAFSLFLQGNPWQLRKADWWSLDDIT